MQNSKSTNPHNIVESPFQYRRTYNEASLIALAETMKPPHGSILQAIVVRPNPHPEIKNFGSDDPIEYELVFGHRRRRAALIAGLTEVPIDVRDMTDEEVQRAQLIENIGREDVHPIEEAEGFERLMNDHGVTADQITADTGKSRSYVYGRLKLLKAVPSVRDACLRGDIGSEVALLLARLPSAKVQEHALAAIKAQHMDLQDGGKQSYRRIRELLVDKYTLDLSTAIFDITDITLLTDTPCANCLDCPDRSGNAPEFEDITHNRDAGGWTKKGNADICTQPDCFERKKKAHLQREAAKLEAQGKTVIEGNKAKQAMDAHGHLRGGYIPLANVKAELKKAKVTGVATLSIQDPRTGRIVEAVKRDDMVKAGLLKEDDAPKKTSATAGSQRDARTQEEADALTEKNKELLKRMVDTVRGQPRRAADLRMIAQRFAEDTVSYEEDELLEELGLRNSDDLQEDIDAMTSDELAEWLLCASLCFDINAQTWGTDSGQAESLHKIAAEYGAPPAPAETTLTEPTAARAQDETEGKAKKPAARARGKSESKTKGDPNSGKDQSGSAAKAIEGTGDDAGAVGATNAAEDGAEA
jgi:ParB/RepB/Spo0J family partition protein